ncbi:MAG: type I DNA topoisomerase [Calditrichaeota bacterium]|nr:MAG: type I DNA topoisomerase [Calditrichota bacterium]
MSKSLIIVESNAKTKTISKFLGKNYLVLSSLGHVKDLPKQRIGVDVDNGFEPEYITIRGKGKILNQLRKSAAAADKVYIATDPDREGEAIAYHLAEEMKVKKDKIHRVLFNEITEKAVKDALQNPTRIDFNKVQAQKARRVVDRLVGYKVSPVLWRTIYKGLSAGRVQSVALRLICEREEAIENFVPEEYWSITAELQGEKSAPFLSKLAKIDNQPPKLSDESAALQIVGDLKQQVFTVKDIKKRKVKRNPAPPFTTSTMQQAAANRLGFTAKRIMMIAQQLYEGVELGQEGSVGLITYMRTDSTRVSEEALTAVREYILVNYGDEYLPASARRFKVKAGAQDAHEAIRPTSLRREPRKIKRFLTADQYKLYELIWNRFVASQMAPAEFEQTTIDIAAGERYLFRTTGSTVLFRGFLQVYEEEEKAENGTTADESMQVPQHLSVGEVLKLLKLDPQQHFTKPPPRYTESSLVKELDALGIGRPSTYAIIISTLLMRKYIEKAQRQLVPTELGRTVNKILIRYFSSLFNVDFTAHMEEDLDQIEAGKKVFTQVAEEFYFPFKQALEEVSSKQNELKDAVQEETEEKCPKCGRDLIIRWGRNGKFMACSGYPDCKYTKPLEEPEPVDEKCDVCGRQMVIKHGRFGRFLACSGYPECKNTKPLSIGVSCPVEGCSGVLVEKRSRRGRVFYGCSNYPDCKFATWNRPVNVRCQNCQNPYLELRATQAKGEYLFCPVCKSEYAKETEEAYREVAYG